MKEQDLDESFVKFLYNYDRRRKDHKSKYFKGL